MRVTSVLRVLFALFMSASAFGAVALSPMGAGAQAQNGFAMDATRMCGESLALRWDASNVDKIEFSVTDTSINWTTGWIEATDFESAYHYEPIGQRFDKVLVRVTFNDGTVSEYSANIGACETEITTPWPSLEDGPLGDGGGGQETDLVFSSLSLTCSGLVNFTISPADLIDETMYVDLRLGAETHIQRGDVIASTYISLEPGTNEYSYQFSSDLLLNHEGVGVLVILWEPTGSRIADATTEPIDCVSDGGEVVTPGGGGGPTPDDGSFDDPETGNSFEFLTAMRMCEDNSLVTTWSGTNISDIDIMVYNPSPGWGTDWMTAEADSGLFTTSVERDTAYYVDAAVTFTDESVEVVTVHVPDCTSASDSTDDVPDAGLGENNLRVQFNLPDGADISGAPYSLFAPQAAAQAITTPYVSGFVGANNTIAIDGLIPGEYRLVVSPDGMDPIEAMITVGDQPTTTATVTLNADGTVSVAYAAQVVPTPSPEATQAPGGSTNESGSTAAPDTSGSSVSGLPQTGSGTFNTVPVLLAAVAIAALGGLSLVSRHGVTRKQ